MRFPPFLLLLLATVTASSSAVAFCSRSVAFTGIPRGGSDEALDDYEVAQDKVFHAVEDAEKKVLHTVERTEKAIERAIEDEVDTLFHGFPEKESRGVKAEIKTGQKKEKKVSKATGDHVASADDKSDQEDYEVAQERIFHAIENAEKAVLHAAGRAEQAVEHAVEEEVDTLFQSERK